MKRFGSLLLVLILALSLIMAGCGTNGGAAESNSPDVSNTDSPSEPPSEPIKAYFVSIMSGGAAWGKAEQGFMDACAELGWEGQYLAPSATNAITEVVTLTETAVTNGADVVLTVVIDNSLFVDISARAKAAGVTMVGLGGNEELLDAQIGNDYVKVGQDLGKAALWAMEDKEELNVVFIVPMLGAEQIIMQTDAAWEAIKAARPEANLIEIVECNSNASTAQDKLAALKLAHPELNCMVSFDSYAGLGGAAFVEDKGYTPDEFTIIGIDDAEEILRCIVDGTIACTVAQDFYNIGYQGVMLAAKVRNGEPFEFVNNLAPHIIYPDDAKKLLGVS